MSSSRPRHADNAGARSSKDVPDLIAQLEAFQSAAGAGTLTTPALEDPVHEQAGGEQARQAGGDRRGQGDGMRDMNRDRWDAVGTFSCGGFGRKAFAKRAIDMPARVS